MTTTYDEIHEIWKRELRNSELQPLRQGFLKDTSSYIKRLREAQRNLDSKSIKAIVMDDEMRRLEQLLTQLLDRRLRKILADTGLVTSANLESAEKQSLQDASRTVQDYESLKEDLLQGREPSTSKPLDGESILVRFVRDVPSIIGVDLKTHGPFQKEDVARLPHENAESLIRQGAAVEITASG